MSSSTFEIGSPVLVVGEGTLVDGEVGRVYRCIQDGVFWGVYMLKTGMCYTFLEHELKLITK